MSRQSSLSSWLAKLMQQLKSELVEKSREGHLDLRVRIASILAQNHVLDTRINVVIAYCLFMSPIEDMVLKNKRILLSISLLMLGSLFVIFSIHQTMGFNHVYFFWSFTYVAPNLGIVSPGGFQPGGPVITETFEILLPWMITGLVVLVVGALVNQRKG